LSNIALQQLTIGALPKFFATWSISLTLAILTYQAFVRYTWIGRGLHGARTREDCPGKAACQSGPHRELRVERGQPARIVPPVPALPGERRAA
jgi:hypothetical protein